jgi:universal stress protein E
MAFRNICAGVEVSDAPGEASRAALATATWVASKDGAGLHLLSSIDLDPFAASFLPPEEETALRSAKEGVLRGLAAQAGKQGVGRTSVSVPLGPPGETLLADVMGHERDLVVSGTRERGAAARLLLGSTSLHLVRRAPCAVWIARAAFGERKPVVACAIELGNLAEKVVAEAGRLAAAAGGTLHVIHVVDLRAEDVLRAGAADAPYIAAHRKARRERAEKEIPALVRSAAPGVKASAHIVTGDVNETIVRTTEEVRADLLVVANVAQGGVRLPFTLGRTAEHVLGHAKTSVLVLKP